MKSVLLACKTITQEAENIEYQASISESDRSRISAAKDQLSVGLSNLLELAKDHASGRLSTGALESAMSSLTEAIHSLNDAMKLKAVPLPSSNKNWQETLKDSPAPTSWKTPPDSPKREAKKVLDITELRIFLEEQTDEMAFAIQDLLQAMRSPVASGGDLKKLMKQIMDSIDSVSLQSRSTFDRHGSQPLTSNANSFVSLLLKSRDTLEDLSFQIFQQPDNKALKQKIATCSYEIAKNVKELLSLLE
jgi:hypothetical protein